MDLPKRATQLNSSSCHAVSLFGCLLHDIKGRMCFKFAETSCRSRLSSCLIQLGVKILHTFFVSSKHHATASIWLYQQTWQSIWETANMIIMWWWVLDAISAEGFRPCYESWRKCCPWISNFKVDAYIRQAALSAPSANNACIYIYMPPGPPGLGRDHPFLDWVSSKS